MVGVSSVVLDAPAKHGLVYLHRPSHHFLLSHAMKIFFEQFPQETRPLTGGGLVRHPGEDRALQ
jgi:hypothetical protein